eukprot:5667965-Pyramimonas_sp.AAC.1
MKPASGPRNAISFNIATKLQAIAFPTEFIDLNAVARAAEIRDCIKSGGLHGILEDLDRARDDLGH